MTTDMSPTGDLLVTSIFLRGGFASSLLRQPHMLHWHGTKPGAAYPSGKYSVWFLLSTDCVECAECCVLCTVQYTMSTVYCLLYCVLSCALCTAHGVLCVASDPLGLPRLRASARGRGDDPTGQHVTMLDHPCGRGNSAISDA